MSITKQQQKQKQNQTKRQTKIKKKKKVNAFSLTQLTRKTFVLPCLPSVPKIKPTFFALEAALKTK